MVRTGKLAAIVAVCGSFASCAPPPARAPASSGDAVERSNAFAMRLLAVDGAFNPESVGALGVDGFDDAISDLAPRSDERALHAYQEIEQAFRAARDREEAPAVRIDLDLLAAAARRKAREIELLTKYGVPDIEVADAIATGVASLLDDRGGAARPASAALRLRKYVGLEPGTSPLTRLAEANVKTRLARSAKPFLVRARVERYLERWRPAVAGLGAKLAQHGLVGMEAPLELLEQQLTDYDRFLRTEVLPRAEADVRKPEELYAFELARAGIDMPPRALAAMARKAFGEIQDRLKLLAVEVAATHGLASHDYRDVLRFLKKDQIEGDRLIALYERRIHEVEAIVRDHAIVSLPRRSLRFRLATDVESESVPAPRYVPPPMLSNRGEEGTFLLPRGTRTGRFDDFSSDAASWWLTAHEGRPGHDLQYSRMVETHVSLARAVFADNSANAEGWGLYAEALIEPYVPADARMAILQARLMRAAHAFLDPELNLGLMRADEARRIMVEDVVFSEAWANAAVLRYLVWWPGQAPSYLYGYLRLEELRRDVEAAWGARFTALRFHDAVIAEGFLPYPLLRRALLE